MSDSPAPGVYGGVDSNRVLGFILLTHLDIFYWLEAENVFVVDHISKDKLSGTFCV